MTKKEFSYIVFSSSGDNVQEIHGVYKDLEGAAYGAKAALSTLFPNHGDKAEIIRCEIISTAGENYIRKFFFSHCSVTDLL